MASVNWFDILQKRTGGAGPVLVVDGGATGSRGALSDLSGSVLGYAEGGPTNARAVGDARAAQHLQVLVGELLRAGGVTASQLGYCLCTLAGVDTLGHSRYMSGSIVDLGVRPESVVTVPDTIGCWADTNSLLPAVVVIAGTGSVVLAGDLSRRICRKFGGWDFVLGDEGSGYSLGRAALRESMLVSEERSTGREILARCLDALGLAEPDEIPDAIHKPTIDKSQIAALGLIPLERAEAGDADAGRIVDSEVAELVHTVIAGVRVLGPAHGATIGTYGSIFQSSYFRSRFVSLVGEACGDGIAMSSERLDGALIGAFRLALWCNNRPPEELDEHSQRFESTLAGSRLGRPPAAGAGGDSHLDHDDGSRGTSA